MNTRFLVTRATVLAKRIWFCKAPQIYEMSETRQLYGTAHDGDQCVRWNFKYIHPDALGNSHLLVPAVALLNCE